MRWIELSANLVGHDTIELHLVDGILYVNSDGPWAQESILDEYGPR